ncbi:hypothetical protein [Limnobacter sp.]|uniref:hypothetical protein n=1 Tax=Limnobacter sp. TaxID=2003368 RepID=UPI00311F43D7
MKITRRELRKLIVESLMLNEAQENLPKANQSRVRAAASTLEPKPDGRFSATVKADGDRAAVEVDDDSSVSKEHEEKLKRALETDGILGFKKGQLDK